MNAENEYKRDQAKWRSMIWLDPTDPEASYAQLLEAFPEIQPAQNDGDAGDQDSDE